jgi:plastocyanin
MSYRFVFVILAGLLALSGLTLVGSSLGSDRGATLVGLAHDDHDDDDAAEEAAEATEEAIEIAEEIAEEAAEATEEALDDLADREGDEDGEGDGVPAAAGVAGDPVETLEVRMAGERFTPAVITVEVGQTVTFINDDDDEHTATGTTFDTGPLQPGESATVTFDQVGTFDYICQFHADMRGQVIVTGATSGGTPDAAESSPAASPEASPVASPDVAATPEAVPDRVEIDIVDFAFEPSSLTIPAGTTVIWTNTGVAPHTVTGDFADSGILEPGQTFEWSFTDAGTFPYLCSLHPQMTAEIIVDPNARIPDGS